MMKKTLTIIIVCLVASTVIRLSWLHYLTSLEYEEEPVVVEGLLDLRGWEFSNKKTLKLNGEWAFFPSALITEADQHEGPSRYIQVPNDWSHTFNHDQDEHRTFQYGTYKLKILLDEDNDQTLGLRINEIRNASTVYANGQLVASNGQPAASLTEHEARQSIPYSVVLTPVDGQLELVIQVSSHAQSGGITYPIRFGTVEAIGYLTAFSNNLQLLLCVVLFLHALYALMLYLLGLKNKALLFFSFIMVFGLLSVLVADDHLLFVWFEFSYEWSMRIIRLIYIGAVAFMPFMFHSLFPGYIKQKILHWFIGYCSLYALFVLFAPIPSILAYNAILFSVLLLSVALSAYILWKAVRSKKDVTFLLLASMLLGVNVLWAIAKHSLSLGFIHYPFDLIGAVLAFAAFWFRQSLQATMKTKQLAEQLQIEDKRKDEFLVNTSHELRNPLHGILNMTQVIVEDTAHPIHDKHKKNLTIVIDVSKRLSLMLDDLLDITRLRENTIQLKWEQVSLSSIIAGVYDIVRLQLEEKPVTLTVEIADTFPPVWADKNRLIQIIFNLVHNAVKYTDRGTILIRAASVNGIAHIQVEDTGIGIEEKALKTILEPYKQAELNSERASGGFGLGLSITKQLVELHGGMLTVQSTPGEGSVFTFTLPLSEGSTQGDEMSTAAIIDAPLEIAATVDNISTEEPMYPANSKLKILAVDDDNMNVTILKHVLEAEQYEVSTATNAQLALARLEQSQYDLVISDVMMPHISGYALTSKIRERFSAFELPILLLTARSRSEDIMAGLQSGANDYITKPVDAMELKARVQALTKLKLSVEERLRMEGAWLQSQIQPHFLFNTLNSIAALGVSDVSKMQALLEEFSNYLRLSFDFKNSNPVVPLQHELSLVDSYLYIEKQRFGDRIHVKWEIASSDQTLYIPPLSIQPLVENAVNHGIMNKRYGGTIWITIEVIEEHCVVTIKDDGVGMTALELEQLLDEEISSNKRSKVGLRNVNRRLKQLYNQGLLIESSPDQGTTISFQVPIPSSSNPYTKT